MKYYSSLMTELAKQQIWVISENGYYYSQPLHFYWDEKQAKQCWENLSQSKWENYKEYIKSNAGAQYGSYYALEQYTLANVFEKEISQHTDEALWTRKKEIEIQGIEGLADSIEYHSRCKSKELVSNIIKYLQNLKEEI